jgi:hypothetical protein
MPVRAVAELPTVPEGYKFEGALVAALSTEDLKDILASPRRSTALTREVQLEIRRRARVARRQAERHVRRPRVLA